MNEHQAAVQRLWLYVELRDQARRRRWTDAVVPPGDGEGFRLDDLKLLLDYHYTEHSPQQRKAY